MSCYSCWSVCCIVGWWLSGVDVLLTNGNTLHLAAIYRGFVSRLRCEKGNINTLRVCIIHSIALVSHPELLFVV